MRKFSKSVKATEKLVARCGLKLMSDCPTRWNSTYLMVSRLLAVRPHVTEVLQELEWDNLPNSDWKVLENYRDLLEPFARYTALTGGEEYTTLSMVVPVVMELTYHLNEVSTSDNTYLHVKACGFCVTATFTTLATAVKPEARTTRRLWPLCWLDLGSGYTI